MKKADVLMQQGRYAEAEREAGKVLSVDPKDEQALLLIGNCKVEAEQYDEAVELLTKTLENYPENDHALYLIAFSHFFKNQLDKAEKHLFKAIELCPYKAPYYSLFANVLIGKEDYASALKMADIGLSLQPSSISCLNAKSRTYIKLRQFGKAKETYHTILKVEPDHPAGHFGLGWICLSERNPRQAKEHFIQSLKKDPNQPEAIEGHKICLRMEVGLHRHVSDFQFWLARQSNGKKTSFLLAFWFAACSFLFLGNKSWSELVSHVLFFLSTIVCLTIWLQEPLTNFFLQFQASKRIYLSPTEVKKARRVGFCMAMGTALMPFVFFQAAALETSSLTLFSFAFLFNELNVDGPKKRTGPKEVALVLLFCLGSFSLATNLLSFNMGKRIFAVYMLGLIGYVAFLYVSAIQKQGSRKGKQTVSAN